MFPTKEPSELSITAFDSLVLLSERLYCLSAAMRSHLPPDIGTHEYIMSSQLTEAWLELEDIINDERDRHEACREEMKKFTEGFAYGRPKGLCAGGG